MENTTPHKRKKAVAATVAAAAILLAGTFAWTSISQQAKNEAIVDINPGGRLHDDFNGTNKDVYVENFGDKESGVDIFARVKLTQYMEIGQEAGINTDAANRKAVSLIEGDTFSDRDNWETYIPGKNETFDTYWSWKMGNTDAERPYYLPTFNMNKDSLIADINGDYEGTVPGDIVHYDNYVEYDADSDDVVGDEVYDWDDNDITEEFIGEDGTRVTYDDKTPRDDADVYVNKGVSHEIKQVNSAATVITMEEWLQNPVAGPYWVYDKDGWAYWAQPIKPGETTGLLLDSIQMTKVPDDNWYYGINVVGQFATAGDLKAFTMNGEKMSDDAKKLFGAASALGSSVAIEGVSHIAAGTSTTFTATVKQAAVNLENQPGVIWSVSGGNGKNTISADGVLKVDAGEANNTELTITATSKADGSITDTRKVTVLTWHEYLKVAEYGDKIYADGREWWVVAKEDDRAMIYAATAVARRNFASATDTNAYGSNIWRDSGIRTWLNETYINQLTETKDYIAESTIYTASQADRRASGMEYKYIETKDKLFLLSEADFSGTFNGYNEEGYMGEANADYVKEYSAGKVGIIVNKDMMINQQFFRSPHIIYIDRGWQEWVATYDIGNGVNKVKGVCRFRASDTMNICPAMWIDLTK